MGQFSWDCHCCGRSMRCARKQRRNDPEAWRSDVVFIAQTGERMEGVYDGYGRVGGVPMPDAWGDDFDAIVDKASAERSEAIAAKVRAGCGDILAKPDAALSESEKALVSLLRSIIGSHELLAGRARESAAEATAACICFTAYHRRCWQEAGEPGFQGQSKRALDQGA